MKIEKICVYCESSAKVDKLYSEASVWNENVTNFAANK